MKKILIALIGEENGNYDAIFWHGGETYSIDVVRKDARFNIRHLYREFGEFAKQRLYDAEMSRCHFAPLSEWNKGYRSLYKGGVLRIPNYA